VTAAFITDTKKFIVDSYDDDAGERFIGHEPPQKTQSRDFQTGYFETSRRERWARNYDYNNQIATQLLTVASSIAQIEVSAGVE